MSTAHIAAARRAERRIVARLREAGATSAATAQPIEVSGMEARRFGRLQQSGVVVQAGPGRYYLDADAHASIQGRRRVRLIIMLSIAAVVAVAALASRAF